MARPAVISCGGVAVASVGRVFGAIDSSRRSARNDACFAVPPRAGTARPAVLSWAMSLFPIGCPPRRAGQRLRHIDSYRLAAKVVMKRRERTMERYSFGAPDRSIIQFAYTVDDIQQG